jgi:flavin-dependent dehydrogenase
VNGAGSFETDCARGRRRPGRVAAAYHLARTGSTSPSSRRRVPREKVCGDGLTPRSVKAIQDMGVDTDDPRFERVIGSAVTRGARLQLPWPDLTSFPPFGLVMPRDGFDHLLGAARGEGGRALIERTEAIAPRVRRRVRAGARPRRRVSATPSRPIRARYVIAADGAASRFATPAASAATRQSRSGSRRALLPHDYHPGPWIESWLDLWDGDLLLPGYGGSSRSPGPDQPRRRPAEHVHELQGRLGAAAVRCVRAMLPPSGRVARRRPRAGCSRARCR